MASLNGAQRNSIQAAFRVLHRKMADLEGLIAQGSKSSPLAEYVPDLTLTEAKVVHDYFARIRAVMLADLEEAGIPLDFRRTSLRWAVECGVTSLSIMVDDMGPRKLSHYGPLDDDGRARATKVQEDVRRLVDRLAAYIRQGQGRDLAERLARLERDSEGVVTLSKLERIIARWHLVEFRPVLDMIVGRLESPSFEVAVFGRVSSGKSSLLNHIAGRDALPVGVTPVTAVPTRLRGGNAASAVVSFAELPDRAILLEDVWEYASEEGNPGNAKHVTGIVVTLPSSRLGSEAVFVDTPGVGSLALSGGAEALAYLPRADLGVVLVDAASTPNDDDLSLLRALYGAGVPAMVLLSKADLISEADRERMIRYMKHQFRRELGLEFSVHPVSIVGPGEALLTRWFEEDLRPLLARHRCLVEASLRRKIGYLRESVVAVLQTLLAKRRGAAPARGMIDAGDAKRLLAEADLAIRDAGERLDHWRGQKGRLAAAVLRRAVEAVASGPAPSGTAPVARAVEEMLRARAREVHALVLGVKETLGGTLREVAFSTAVEEPVVEFVIGGLPASDLGALARAAEVHLPGWASIIPGVALWWAERAVGSHLGPEIERVVERYDGRLQAWARENFSRLVALYESQAEAIREQIRRLSTGDGEGGISDDGEALERDLRDLEGSGDGGGGATPERGGFEAECRA